jgi:hypothetical protein
VHEKTAFKTIESLARFTVDEMKEKLRQKKAGKCECKPSDVLCKTMCGTLLGPGARDVTLGPPARDVTLGQEASTSGGPAPPAGTPKAGATRPAPAPSR